ncbi:MAG TPA: AMP-binding protein, partial [Longimicrobiales bacterium]|nr:AMP-binding protein [Longimicrobiales bacterium]
MAQQATLEQGRDVREVPIADWLSAAARRDPRKVYISDVGSGRELTYGEVAERVNRLAHALDAAGIKKGDRIALWAFDSHRFLETMWASMKIGALFVPLNTRLTEGEVTNFLRVTEPSILFVSDDMAKSAHEIAAGIDSIARVVDFDDVDDFEGLVASGSASEFRVQVLDSDPIGLAFTSGTTGLPKQVIQTQRMLKWICVTIATGWQIGVEESLYTGISLFHISGLAVSVTGAYLADTVYLAPSFRPDAVVDLLERGEVTTLLLVPSMVAMVVEKARGRGPFTGLRRIHYGAAAMPIPVLRSAVDLFGCEFVQTFGAGTESGGTTFLSSYDHVKALDGSPHILKSVGRPGPGVEVRICDDSWNDIPTGEVGEVVLRCDQIMAGYVNQPEETANAVNEDGWFRAGDLGYRDEEGYIYLVDRKSNMIIRGGENIYPVDIEQVIYEYPGVAECAVVAGPHEILGEVPVGHVVMQPGVP